MQREGCGTEDGVGVGTGWWWCGVGTGGRGAVRGCWRGTEGRDELRRVLLRYGVVLQVHGRNGLQRLLG